MQDIEKLKAKHEEALREAVEDNRISLALPVMPSRVMFSLKSLPWVGYDVDTMEQALDIFKQYTPHPWQKGSGTFTTLAPAEEFARKNTDNYKHFVDIDGAPYFDCMATPNYPSTCEMEFFAGAAGRLLKLCVRIAHSPIRVEIRLNDAHSRTAADRYTKVYPTQPGAKVIQWGYGNDATKGTYWYPDLATFWVAMEAYVPGCTPT